VGGQGLNERRMKMVIPRDAISKEDFDAMERGIPVYRKPQPKKADPTPPNVPNQVRFEDICGGEVEDAEAKPSSRKNAEGSVFCGYNFFAKFRDGKVVQGWMTEFDMQKFKKIIPEGRTDILTKLSW
jgi:hypothetical protein